jgi:hypothetical protein
VNTDRKAKTIDLPLLRSPNLHSLSYTIYYTNCLVKSCASEFAALRDVLLGNKALTSLNLRTEWDDAYTTTDYRNGELNLQIEPGMRLPDLQELTLDCYDTYHLSQAHCQTWRSCMNWDTLRSLDLEKGCPRYLISALTDAVPHLKRLAFGFWPNHQRVPTWDCPDLEIIKRFLTSINGLEYVRVFCWDDKDFRLIRPTLLEKHGASLRELFGDYSYRDGWDLGEVEKVCKKASGLQVLSTSLSMRQEGSGAESRSRWVRCFSHAF